MRVILPARSTHGRDGVVAAIARQWLRRVTTEGALGRFTCSDMRGDISWQEWQCSSLLIGGKS